MYSLLINTAIFLLVMSIQEKEVNGEYTNRIDLPRVANLLNLSSIKDKNEIELLKKYANHSSFTDHDFEKMFKLFINNTKRPISAPNEP